MSTTNPFSTTTTTTTTASTLPPPPPTQQQHQQPQQHIHPNVRPPATPNPNQGILYPVASSGRGFMPKPIRPNSNTSDHTVTVANHSPYPPRPNHFPHHHNHPLRPPITHQLHIPPPIRGIAVSSPHPKVAASSSPMADSNEYKNSRDKKSETIAIIRDRKVRISEGASLYALCRSWLKNGLPEESQPQYGDGVKCLPRPLPMLVDSNMAQNRESEEEEEEEKDNDKEEVAHLSEKELLKRHVKHAKKVRARLREERAKRIERYKTRLSLLLPPLVEQSRNDGAAGN
ncbi:uncharacterized protein LOC123215511 [Mangifera indica]|uniref:uncharacterized protein LOC123215511 n=1 Tax=Mangifera indica TaxID=29780 RepID=UPI001CFAB9BA|nr:uncharacterized protein LOC123215511 [Mangifera indica]